MVSVFDLVALAALSHAAVVTRTEYATHWTTVYLGGHAHSNAAPAIISDLPSPTSQEGFTTTLTVPFAAGERIVTLTYDPKTGYILPTDLFAVTTAAPVAVSSAVNYQYIPNSEAASPEPSSSPSSSVAEAVSTTALRETSSSAAPTPSSDSSLDSFASECVEYHNQVRSAHQAGPVTWDEDLAGFAANYLNGNCNFAHSGGPYGENIAMGYGSATAAMQAWYDENKDYDYASGLFGENTGHFTQMVWKATKKIGCAQTECGGSGKYLVCEYADSRGNVIGNFVSNVLPSA